MERMNTGRPSGALERSSFRSRWRDGSVDLFGGLALAAVAVFQVVKVNSSAGGIVTVAGFSLFVGFLARSSRSLPEGLD